MRQIHLICNAHIDPVWQWEWEEGAAAALSTFRAAAELCEESDDFVFCHNEALLYQWVEEYEPKLFERIRALVKAGKWRITGGWYLQPDVNMPGGESLIRQMTLGRAYFAEKFGVSATTAVSFDAFGHNRGLVQLLKKAGYDSYLFMRPDASRMALPADDFIWVGYDGSEVLAHRINTGYNSALGGALDKLKTWLAEHPNAELGLMAWGVGNHGGGPSRKDIRDINAFKRAHPEAGIRHSSPEEYFKALAISRAPLKKVYASLAPFAVGCYTSQIRVKQKHRALEGLLNQTERMLAHAAMAGLIEYPARALEDAARDLCLSEFHDILPGTSIEAAEQASLNTLGRGIETASRLRARAFFALAAGKARAKAGEYPVLVYNPFPYELDYDVECEFMLADQNWNDEFTDISVYQNGARLKSQVEKERSNLPLDWRKRAVFRARLKPMQINRFDCVTNVLKRKIAPARDAFALDNGRLRAEINAHTGLLSAYRVDGFDYLAGEAFKLLVINDNADPWGMTVDRFRDVAGEFALMSPDESARFAGVDAPALAPVRVIEDGEVRAVIEACFIYNDSRALITYKLPKAGRALGVEVRLYFAERDKLVKLSIPAALKERFWGQGVFGAEDLRADGGEAVYQQWCAARGQGRALGLINDGVHGGDFLNGEMRVSLARGAGYTAHPIGERQILPQDRFSQRIDNGMRAYKFVLEGGAERERMNNLTREAQALNEPPYALSYFPGGDDGARGIPPAARLHGEGVQMSALRKAQSGEGWIMRLFECAGENGKRARVELPILGISADIDLSAHEAATLLIDPIARAITKTGILA